MLTLNVQEGGHGEYLHSNPLAEHNSGIALSSKQVPFGGTANMYNGQGGHTFVQGGGGGGSFYGFNGIDSGNEYAKGSYSPVMVGHNANPESTFQTSAAAGSQSGGSKRRKRSSRRGRGRGRGRRGRGPRFSARKLRSYKYSRGTLFGGKKRGKRARTNKNKKTFIQKGGNAGAGDIAGAGAGSGSGGGGGGGGNMVVGWGAPNGSSVNNYPNAAYSVGGTLPPQTTALANPAPIQAYNSAHPVL